MFTMQAMVNRVAYLFGGHAPSRWAVIRCGWASRRYGYPAIHRAIRHGYLAYGADGRSVELTEAGRAFLGA